MRRPVFISAPFAPRYGRTVEENVARAVALCHLAVEAGYAPICVHTTIQAGGYGSDESAKDRARGLDICKSLVDMVFNQDGDLWVLADRVFGSHGLSYSDGVAREIKAFAAGASEDYPVTVKLYVWDDVGDKPQHLMDLTMDWPETVRYLGL